MITKVICNNICIRRFSVWRPRRDPPSCPTITTPNACCTQFSRSFPWTQSSLLRVHALILSILTHSYTYFIHMSAWSNPKKAISGVVWTDWPKDLNCLVMSGVAVSPACLTRYLLIAFFDDLVRSVWAVYLAHLPTTYHRLITIHISRAPFLPVLVDVSRVTMLGLEGKCQKTD